LQERGLRAALALIFLKPTTVPTTQAFWHFANFFAPAAVTGYLASGIAKLVWRRELAASGWLRMGTFASAAMAVVSTLGLVMFDHDGKMATYAGMVGACAAALWWTGFRRRKG
jgi:hypothetical protein